MSNEGLRRWRVEESSVQAAAAAVCIRHVQCDPDAQQRQALGIPSYDELKKARSVVEPTAKEAELLEADERKYWPIRERYWLDRIKHIEHSRVLFIVGPNHIESFAALLALAGYEVRVICERWVA